MKVLKIVIGVWIVAISTSVPWVSIPTLRQSRYPDGTPVTVCRNPLKHTWQHMYVVTLFVLFFLVPCLMLFVLNCHLCRVLKNTEGNEPCIQGYENLKERKRRRHQVVNIIASIVSIFFICHLPCRIVFLWYSFGDKHFIYDLGLEFNLVILYSARIMFYLNHAINPVVYNFVSTKFRNALREMCSRKKSRYLSYASMTLQRGRRNDNPSFCFNNTRSTMTKNSRLNNKWMPDINAFTNRNNYRSQAQYRISDRTAGTSNDNSQSSSRDYDVKISLENKTVAIKFNLGRKGENKRPVSV